METQIKYPNSNFLQYSISQRFTRLVEDKNPDYIYMLLSKHFNESIDRLKSKYEIILNTTRQRINITGSSEDIYELVNYCIGYGINFESITMKEVRVDFNQFINKIK